MIGNTVYMGKIIKVEEDTGSYIVEDLETKERYTVDEDDVFLGDD